MWLATCVNLTRSSQRRTMGLTATGTVNLIQKFQRSDSQVKNGSFWSNLYVNVTPSCILTGRNHSLAFSPRTSPIPSCWKIPRQDLDGANSSLNLAQSVTEPWGPSQLWRPNLGGYDSTWKRHVYESPSFIGFYISEWFFLKPGDGEETWSGWTGLTACILHSAVNLGGNW